MIGAFDVFWKHTLPVRKLTSSPTTTTVAELWALYHMYDREYKAWTPEGLRRQENTINEPIQSVI